MEVLLKGIGVGFAVAAPVGPIGLLCIRRTLANGRAAGLASGFGAAAADSVYGLMVTAGLAATGILVSYAGPLELIGGLLIAVLGALSLKSFLVWDSSAPESAGSNDAYGRQMFGAFVTTFALPISNPMTILAFVGLVAGLGASAAGDPGAPYWLVFGVFLGSVLWWLCLVHVTLAVRSRITTAATRWLDLASGAVLFVWGFWITAGALYYRPPTREVAESLSITLC